MRLPIFVVALTMASHAFGQDGSRVERSEEFLKECSAAIRVLSNTNAKGSSAKEDLDADRCLWYVRGYLQGLQGARAFGNMVCVPGQASTAQLVRVVVKYLEGNPSHLPG